MGHAAQTSLDADVVVVGGGSAGCAAAYRLTHAGLRVLLVEAGPDYGPAGSGRWPAELLDPRWLATTHDWGFTEQRPDPASPGRVRSLPTPRARVIGGCSAHNQCGAWWGLSADYDRWAQLTGDRRWSWHALRPYVDQVEGARGGGGGVALATRRGSGGLLPTCPGDEAELAVWQRAFLDAALAVGYPRVADLSGAALPDGVAPFWMNIADGRRVNSAFAFLDPMRGRADLDLRVVDRVLADRLMVERGRAVALVCRRDGADGEPLELELTARSFVLAAGTYGSPAVLLRSGIGPAASLAALGIPVAVDLPGVGANLHDHPGVALRFAPSARARGLLDAELAAGRCWQAQVGLRAKAGRLHLFPYQSQLDNDNDNANNGAWVLELYAFLLAPRSRGRLWLRSPDPVVPPGIDFGFLSDGGGRDLAALRRGMALAGELARTPALARMCVHEAQTEAEAPITGTGRQRHRPAEDAWLRERVCGYSHPVGTCRMGHRGDPTAVVDADGLVVGTTNVMVADASAMPVIPHAGTNLTAMLLGWCVAERLSRRLAGTGHR